MRSPQGFYVCLRFALLFFVCTNYLTVVYCNQPCIVFIYILYIFCCWVEKEPLPQSVEVLSHAAARAATFLVLATIWLRQCRIIIQSYVAAQATFAFSCRCYKSYPVSILCIPYRLLLVFSVLRPGRTLFISIFCGPPDRLAFIGQLHIRTPLVTSTLYILLQLESTCLRSHRTPAHLWQPFPCSRCTLKYVELALADYHASRAKVQYLCYPW